MWDAEMSAAGAEFGTGGPTHQVVRGRRNKVVFAGSRAACWSFRKKHGGFVQEYEDPEWIEEWLA
ncbi:hypothetical protein KLEP181_gp55 [Paracoccus phage vB_PmaP_KLEP18-1]|nr:hypothetical protein KLEP181_gp55 [Paracoccus phage vB_PmaP_KLEP18-1]